MDEFFKTLNSLTPAGLAGLLGYIIFLLVRQRKAVREVSNNHLSGLPEMEQDIKKLNENMVRLITITEQQNLLLLTVAESMAYVKARVNGKG